LNGEKTIRFGILTVSDRAFEGLRDDSSGPTLESAVRARGWQIKKTGLVPDDLEKIMKILLDWVRSGHFDVILTTGGTGFSPRDVTPEATLAVIERSAPGISELMRAKSLEITLHASLSRAIAGIAGSCLIINMPGSPKAALENFTFVEPIIPHAVQLLNQTPDSEAGHGYKKPAD
jgi:molybdenum cofactor synthesis domain-containing protein